MPDAYASGSIRPHGILRGRSAERIGAGVRGSVDVAMKATILLLLSAMLGFAEPAAPGGASSPSEPPAAFAESRPSAEPAPARKHAKPVKVNRANRANGTNGVNGVTDVDCATHARPACRALRGAPCPICPAICANRANRANGVNDVNRANPGKPRLGATATLSDGSVLKGTLRRRFLPADTRPLGRIRLDLRAVASIDATAPQGGAPARYRVAFKNGDRLTVRFPADLKPLRFDTVLGPVPLPLSAVSKLVLEPSPSSPSSTPSTLLYHCTFDSPESISRPVAGPAGTFLGGEFVPGKKGRALLVKARTPAAEVPFPTGLMQPEGCIEFWAKIPGATKETRYPDGGNPQFFAMGVGKWVNTFVKYTANDGFGTGGLHAELPGSICVSTLPSWSGSATYPDFLGDPSAWHHYALVWSEKGLDAASEALGRRVVSALYVDGRLVNPSYGDNGPARAKFLRELVDNPVVLAFPFVRERQEPWQNNVDYLIDEFKIWNFPKTDFSLSSAEPPNRRTTESPKLLYHCTFDDAQSVERPVAGPNGRFLGGEFVPGKKGNALRSNGDVPVAEIDLPKGLLQPCGTIEFWAKIEEPPPSFPDCGNPRFFNLWLSEDGSDAGPCSTHLQFTANDGMGMSGLCGMIYHRAMATDPRMCTNTYGPLLDDPAAWHHYAIVWDSDGLPFSKASDGTPAVATLVLDGKVLQTFGRNQLSKGEGLLKLPSLRGKLAFPVPADRTDVAARHVPFLIDEFKIWNNTRTHFNLD